MHENIWVALTFAALGFFLGWARARGRIVALTTALEGVSQAAADAQSAAEQLAALATLHERRAREFFSIIEGIEKERDGWQGFHLRSSSAAGAAQAWMMRELQRFSLEVNRRGEELRKLGHPASLMAVDPRLVEAIEGFDEGAKQTLPRAPGMDAARLVDQASEASPSPSQ